MIIHDFFEWNKCDLHFHTPASNRTKKDYKNVNVTAKDIVKKLTLPENNLKLVAITDHNIFDLEQFRKLKEEGNNKITFLPGVELKVDGYDVILIIEPKNEDLKNFDQTILNFCNKDRESGKNSVEKVVENFKDFNYIIIPEYNRGNGGDTQHKHGTLENDKFKLKLLCGFYDAADIKNKSNKNKTTVNYFKEMFKYADTHLEGNCIFVSDNHDIEYYPNKDSKQFNTFRGWTYINSEPSFMGLKFALSDASRIVLTKNFDGKPDFINGRDEFLIRNITIRSNSDNSEKIIKFSPFLNTIIGGRSSGKSYLMKKIVAKFDKSTENSFKDEYKEFWNYYSIKIKLSDGRIIDYDETEKSEKIIYLEQNHVIKNIEQTNSLFQEWYRILDIKSPIVDNKSIELKRNKLEKNVKEYFLKITDLKNFIKSLNYELNIFNNSSLLFNANKTDTQLYRKVKSNINKFDKFILNDKKLTTLENEIKTLNFDNYFISKDNRKKIKTNIDNILDILSKTENMKSNISIGLNMIEQKISTANEKESLFEKSLKEFERLKCNYYYLGTKIKEILILKKIVWNKKYKKYNVIKENEEFSEMHSEWKFINNVEFNVNDEVISKELSSIFKSDVYKIDGSLNPIFKLKDFLLANNDELFKNKKSSNYLKNLNFCKILNKNDIIDEKKWVLQQKFTRW